MVGGTVALFETIALIESFLGVGASLAACMIHSGMAAGSGIQNDDRNRKMGLGCRRNT